MKVKKLIIVLTLGLLIPLSSYGVDSIIVSPTDPIGPSVPIDIIDEVPGPVPPPSTTCDITNIETIHLGNRDSVTALENMFSTYSNGLLCLEYDTLNGVNQIRVSLNINTSIEIRNFKTNQPIQINGQVELVDADIKCSNADCVEVVSGQLTINDSLVTCQTDGQGMGIKVNSGAQLAVSGVNMHSCEIGMQLRGSVQEVIRGSSISCGGAANKDNLSTIGIDVPANNALVESMLIEGCNIGVNLAAADAIIGAESAATPANLAKFNNFQNNSRAIVVANAAANMFAYNYILDSSLANILLTQLAVDWNVVYVPDDEIPDDVQAPEQMALDCVVDSDDNLTGDAKLRKDISTGSFAQGDVIVIYELDSNLDPFKFEIICELNSDSECVISGVTEVDNGLCGVDLDKKYVALLYRKVGSVYSYTSGSTLPFSLVGVKGVVNLIGGGTETGTLIVGSGVDDANISDAGEVDIGYDGDAIIDQTALMGEGGAGFDGEATGMSNGPCALSPDAKNTYATGIGMLWILTSIILLAIRPVRQRISGGRPAKEKIRKKRKHN